MFQPRIHLYLPALLAGSFLLSTWAAQADPAASPAAGTTSSPGSGDNPAPLDNVPLPPPVPGPFTKDLSTFEQYQCPAWFRDAKFGIWAHWGPQAVPGDGDWYARKMYQQGSPDYVDHLKRFGPPSKSGYKDIIPLWKAENWDPAGLMALYKKAGARYFVAQAVHHDNFDNWDSKWHEWNSVKMGPHRDMVGTWQKAAAQEGLRFGVTEHLGASFTWFQDSHKSDATGPLAGVPYDGANPLYWSLYHWPARPGDTKWLSNDPRWWHEWFLRIDDLVTHYHPDLLYSDSGLPFGEIGSALVANLYNQSIADHGGQNEAVYNCKEDGHQRWVQDLERGVKDGIDPHPWQTDTSNGDWFYRKDDHYKSTSQVIGMLADIVSKNGNLLLNIVLKPDGSLPAESKTLLDGLAAWMPVNGEAIFGTRPWVVYGESGQQVKGGSFNEGKLFYDASDIRFTTKGDVLYAIVLGWPQGKITIKSLARGAAGAKGDITGVSLLGSSDTIRFKRTAGGLVVNFPKTKPCANAYVLKISGLKLARQ